MSLKKPIPSFLGLGALLLLTSCQGDTGLLSPAGPVADAQRNHLVSIFLWMLVVTVPVFVAVPVLLWRYRLGSNAAYRPRWSYSWPIEILIWAVPVVVVAVLGYNLARETFALDPYRTVDARIQPLDIQVIGYNWKWLFIYPDQNIAMLDELTVPEGRPLRFRVTSVGALQSFMIPQLGGQIYAMPGMVSELNLLANKPGEFKGLNTQYNGAHFAKQHFTVHALNADDYDAWLASAKQGAKTLDDHEMQTIAKNSVPAEPVLYSNINGPSFDAVVKSVRGTNNAHGAHQEEPKS